jgi:hypothetical protein
MNLTNQIPQNDLVVDALGRAVAVGHGQPGGHGGQVLAQAADEPVQGGEIGGLDRGHPAFQLVAAAFGEQRGERVDVLGEVGEVWAGGEQLVEVFAVVFAQVRGSGHDPGDQPPWWWSGPLGVGAALVEVAHE